MTNDPCNVSDRTNGDVSDGISSLKFKRIVRPLLAKINAINDLKEKSPTLTEFNFLEVSKLELANKNIDNVVPSMRSRSCSVLGDSDSDSDSDYDYEGDSFLGGNAVENTLGDSSSKFQRFLHPKDSYARLHALKPYITPELHQHYLETFQIFRTIVATLFSKSHDEDNNMKLSTLAGYKVGGNMALSTKTTYYKWNQSILFDSETIPEYLQDYQDILQDDISFWLEREPGIIFKRYTKTFLLGYITQIMIINLRLIFYLLIPVLIHWLDEEYRQTNIFQLNVLKIQFFNEYWSFGIGSSSEDFTSLQLLNGDFDINDTNKIFWCLYRIGYWKTFLVDAHIESNYSSGSSYNNRILESVAFNKKINFDLFQDMNATLPTKYDYVTEIYDLLRHNHDHPNVNKILIYLAVVLLSQSRIFITSSSTLEEFMDRLQESYDDLTNFLTIWLGIDGETTVFTSVYFGNESIFQATKMMCKYLLKQFAKVNKILKQAPSEVDHELYKQFRSTRNECGRLISVIGLLEVYYLDLKGEILLRNYTADEISSGVMSILFRSDHNHYNSEFNEFLLWLYDRQDPILLDIAQMCFHKYYGKKHISSNRKIQHVLDILFRYI
mgnify:CR=1 FL=1